MSVKFYLVGGAVRDKLLGLESKDMDYAVEAPSYQDMIAAIKERGGEIFLEKPEYATVRAKVPNLGTADFVLCRKDGYYSDGRRPDSVAPGTLLDDLSRRDFTINAMAIDEAGKIIDPFNGQNDLKNKEIKCVGNAKDRLTEDSLRMLRAIRFAITKDMTISEDIDWFMYYGNPELIKNVSVERIREELYKCFKHNTPKTLHYLQAYHCMTEIIFENGLWLKPTLEQR